MSGFNMDDYVDVAERIREFSKRYPEGSLQSDLQVIHEPQTGWLCTAYAYRTPDDPKPGVGHAFEVVPGKTPYTKDSEAMNAETSAWGRAIVALGFETKKIASRQEVQARQNDGGTTAGNGSPGPARRESSPAAAPSTVDTRDPDPHGLQSSRADAPFDYGAVELTFGKHKGSALRDIPRAYLEWWLTQEEPKTDAMRLQRRAAEQFLGIVPAAVTEPNLDADIPF